MAPLPSLDSWVAALSRMRLDFPTPRDSDRIVQANIAAFARRGAQDPDAAVPRLYKIMDRPHEGPAPVKDLPFFLCTCISCKIQRERRATLRYPARLGLGRPAAAPAPRAVGRCLTHGLDTACPLCIQRVTAAEPAGASTSQ